MRHTRESRVLLPTARPVPCSAAAPLPGGGGVRLPALLQLAIGLCMLPGCGLPHDYPPLGHVTGVVTLDDQPVGGAAVSFFPETGRSSSAQTDAQGRYELIFANNVRGAAVGSHTVSINKFQQDPAYVPYPLETSSMDPGPTIINLLPARYSGTKSTLTAAVTEGRNTIDFHLESK